MTRTVVVGTDGSAPSLAAVRWAAGAAYAHGLPLRVTHVAPPSASGSRGGDEGAGPPPWHAARERMVREVRARLDAEHPGLHTAGDVIRDDDVAGGLASAAAWAELLVLGTRGEGGFDGLLLGSTALGVLRRAPCPVALVPQVTAEEPPLSCGPLGPEVALGLDAREPDHEALAYAFGEAALHGLPLHVVHVWDLVPRHDPWQP
ncbi:hypothetical protein GCM10009801_14280 [Streptomyces albiaxialis]|uniref:UspA domain-containing protein n=1 Tax=Streptomyces albiaxialis TaxID=329523 RepID=A0ABN2VPF7_9ACTN